MTTHIERVECPELLLTWSLGSGELTPAPAVIEPPQTNIEVARYLLALRFSPSRLSSFPIGFRFLPVEGISSVF